MASTSFGARTSLHVAERMHVHEEIERRRAGAVGHVRIGALVEQHGREVVVRVDDGDDQRRRAVRVDDVQS